MPSSSPKPCSRPGCCGIVVSKDLCEDHLPTYRRFEVREKTATRGYDNEWRVLSEWKRNVDPICERCERMPADCVDHIIPIAIRPELRLARRNLQSLCNPCHAEKTSEDRKLYAGL